MWSIAPSLKINIVLLVLFLKASLVNIESLHQDFSVTFPQAICGSIAVWPTLFLMKSFCPLRILQILPLALCSVSDRRVHLHDFICVCSAWIRWILSFMHLQSSNVVSSQIRCPNWILDNHPLIFFLFFTSEFQFW